MFGDTFPPTNPLLPSASRTGVPAANPAGRLAPQLPNAEQPRSGHGVARPCVPHRAQTGALRPGPLPAENAAGPGAPGRERVPHAAEERGGAGGRKGGRRAMDRDLGSQPLSLLARHALACLTPVQNDSETWTSVSSCRRFTLWTQFSPKMLSAGISVPRFQWQEGEPLPPMDTGWHGDTACPGCPQQLGAAPAAGQRGWVFSWCNCAEVHTRSR